MAATQNVTRLVIDDVGGANPIIICDALLVGTSQAGSNFEIRFRIWESMEFFRMVGLRKIFR